MKQCDRILEFARDRGEDGFTRLDALTECGVFELASRILELEKVGHVFARQPHRGLNRYGEPVRMTRYSLQSEAGA